MTNVGIIGTGIIARDHAEAIAMTGGRMKLVAACDVQADRLASFCADFGVARRHDDPLSLIADPGVDLVVVATPPSSHESLVIPALERGKYVLCEKPLAHSLASARRIADAAARHSGKLSVSYQLRYHPPFQRLIWLIQKGWVGKVRSAQAERHNYIPHTEHGAKGWWGAWSVAGGGVLITQMIHELDLLVQIMGLPQSVTAIADTRFTTIESEDYLEAELRFSDGRSVRCVASVNSGTRNGAFTITGEAGTAGPGRLALLDDARQTQAAAAVDAAIPLPAEPSSGRIGLMLAKILGRLGVKPQVALSAHARLYLEIEDAIANGKPLPIPAFEAITSLELCMAIYESAITGREIALPLAADSMVYEGVQVEDYAARKCDRNVPSAVFIPVRPAPPKLPASRAVVDGIKLLMAHFGITTAHIKALIRKPAQVHGGPKARHRPWPQRRHFDHREIRAVTRLLKKETLFGEVITYDGNEEQAYCEAFAKYLGGGYADAVNAGSNAVYLALRALDLPPGSEVIVPPATDAGGSMPVAMNLCVPIPADSAPGIINTSVEQIKAVLSARTSAILIAHIGGHPVDMDPILALAAERGIPVIEDCAQAHGAIYKGRMVGTLGAISAFSTMFGKHHCTGGQGGIVFTRDPSLFAKAKRAADRGKAFGALGNPGNLVASLNFNQNELAMAIGRVQLAKLPGFLTVRRGFARLIEEGLKEIAGVSLLLPPEGANSSYLFILLKLDAAHLTCASAAFTQGLADEGIDGVLPGYARYPTDQPWYRQAKVFGDSGLPWSLHQEKPRIFELENIRKANQSLVFVDVHENLTPREARDLLTAIRKVAGHYRVV